MCDNLKVLTGYFNLKHSLIPFTDYVDWMLWNVRLKKVAESKLVQFKMNTFHKQILAWSNQDSRCSVTDDAKRRSLFYSNGYVFKSIEIRSFLF